MNYLVCLTTLFIVGSCIKYIINKCKPVTLSDLTCIYFVNRYDYSEIGLCKLSTYNGQTITVQREALYDIYNISREDFMLSCKHLFKREKIYEGIDNNIYYYATPKNCEKYIKKLEKLLQKAKKYNDRHYARFLELRRL